MAICNSAPPGPVGDNGLFSRPSGGVLVGWGGTGRDGSLVSRLPPQQQKPLSCEGSESDSMTHWMRETSSNGVINETTSEQRPVLRKHLPKTTAKGRFVIISNNQLKH